MIDPDPLAAALDRVERIVRQGQTALPTLSFVSGFNRTRRLILSLAPEHMERGFHVARAILVHTRTTSFLLTGETHEPEGVYAAAFAPSGAEGLFRPITRTPKLSFGPDHAMSPEHLEPMLFLRPEEGETLDANTAAKIRTLISLHSQIEDDMPVIITASDLAQTLK